MTELPCHRCRAPVSPRGECACKDGIALICGDCRNVLPYLEKGCVDLVLTDPPYSSGGLMRSDRNQKPSVKYQMSDTINIRHDFSGDSRDQRSFLIWCDLWMREAMATCNGGGAIVSFVDWRQLPTMIDAVQVAGWVYRGLAAWDKTEASRPQKGWFRAQMEFLVLATCGAMEIDYHGADAASPGIFRFPVPRERVHVTEKPIDLLKAIIQTRADWQTILDPFCGSGTTLRAAKDLGRRAIGIEVELKYVEIAARRLDQSVLPFTPLEQVKKRHGIAEPLFLPGMASLTEDSEV